MAKVEKFAAYEDIFRNGDGRDEIVKLPINSLHDFPGHPFSVSLDEDMQKLKASIADIGVQQPITVRVSAIGGYDIISGHRRVKASQMAGLKEIDAVIKNMSDYEAISWMVESNLTTRETIKPSEKAKALYMEFSAFKDERGMRNVVGRSDEVFAREKNISRMQLNRYLQLLRLLPEYQKQVDDGKMPFNVGAELAVLSLEEQEDVYKIAEENKVKINMSTVNKLKKHRLSGSLTEDDIYECLLGSGEETEAEGTKKLIKAALPEKIKKCIPKAVAPDKWEDYISEALRYYNRHIEQKKDNHLYI